MKHARTVCSADLLLLAAFVSLQMLLHSSSNCSHVRSHAGSGHKRCRQFVSLRPAVAQPQCGFQGRQVGSGNRNTIAASSSSGRGSDEEPRVIQQAVSRVARQAGAVAAAALFAASAVLSPVAVLPAAAHGKGSMQHDMPATGAPGTMASRCGPQH